MADRKQTIGIEMGYCADTQGEGYWRLVIHHNDLCGRLILQAQIESKQFSKILGLHPQVVEADVYAHESGSHLEKKRLAQIASIINKAEARGIAANESVELTSDEMHKIRKFAEGR